MIFNKYKIQFYLWFKNLFKYKHGYAKNCGNKKSIKCPVCRTLWPVLDKTPSEKYLESVGYYKDYTEVIRDGINLKLPKGMSGQELIDLAKKLKPEYDILTKGKSEEEVIKRGATEGYDDKKS